MSTEFNSAKITLIDSHAHIDMAAFDEDRPEMMTRAQDAGVTTIINMILGPDPTRIEQTLAWYQTYPHLRFALGIHPHDAKHYLPETLSTMLEYYQQPTVVAVGEVGLDYYYQHSPKADQQACFEAFLALAGQRQLPVVVHTRDAFDDTVAILKSSGVLEGVPVVIHCFSGDRQQAKKYLDMGAHISFSGIVTFNKAHEVQGAATYVPTDRLLIETDAPYLAPTPHRGKRNEPAFVVMVAEKIAQLRHLPVAELCTRTSDNARRFFGLKE